MNVLDIAEVIPEKNIVVFSPHFDDFPFMMGGYIFELRRNGILDTKAFHIMVVFPRSNYGSRNGDANYDTSLERIKLMTGKRVIEDIESTNELLGEYNYIYELGCEREAMVRGKVLADSEMEYPQGSYDNFNEEDKQIMERMKARIRRFVACEDQAIVVPIAIKEHIDHFIVREAALQVAKEAGSRAKATFYFQEDKPYFGLATAEETGRVDAFARENRLESRPYVIEPEKTVEHIFKHFVSQADPTFKKGILQRGEVLQKQFGSDRPCDQMYRLPVC